MTDRPQSRPFLDMGVPSTCLEVIAVIISYKELYRKVIMEKFTGKFCEKIGVSDSQVNFLHHSSLNPSMHA